MLLGSLLDAKSQDDETAKIDNQDYLDIKRREIEQLGLGQVREEVVDRGLDAESVTWLRGKIGELIPNLIELLKDLEEDDERFAALSTIKQIVRELARDRSFLHALPQLTAAIFFLKCGQDGLVFNAANECLDDIVSCSTHRRLVNIAEEAVGITNENRVRDRAMNCILQIMLTWPAAKLQRQEAQLQGILLAAMTSPNTTRHMRKIARRSSMVSLKRLPQEAKFRMEMGPKLAERVEKEELWVLAQLRNCTFGIANVTDSAVMAESSSEEEEDEEDVNGRKIGVKKKSKKSGVGKEDSFDKIDNSMAKTKESAVAKKRWKKVKMAALIQVAGYKAAVKDAQRTTPLHWLCASPTLQLKPLKSLLEVLTLDSRVAEDAYHRTPLHVLCASQLVTGAMLMSMLSGQPETGADPKIPSKERSALHVDETRRTPLHHLCSNRHAWSAEKMELVAAIAGKWPGWDKCDKEGRTPLDLLASNNQLHADTLDALVGSSVDIARLTILTRPHQPHAPITMDEYNTCSVTPLHWLCMQHIEASASADTVPLRTLRAVVDAYPEAASIAGPDGNTPLHLLCMGQHTVNEHLLIMSTALSSCWEVRNDKGDRPLDMLAADRRITPATMFDLVKHTPRVAEVPMKDIRNPWSDEPLTVLHWICVVISSPPEDGVASALLGKDLGGADYRDLLVDLILTHEKIDHTDAWRAELAPLKRVALRKRAIAEGIGKAELEEAEESYDPKGAVVDLIVAQLREKDDAGVKLREEVTALARLDREMEATHTSLETARVSVLHKRALVVGLKRVIEAFPDATIRQDEEGRTPLHIFCTDSEAFADAITVFIEPMADLSSASLHTRDAYSNSVIDLMSAYGALSADLLRNIVEKSSIVATVEIKDTHGQDCNEFGRGHVMKLANEYITPLHWLCAQPDLKLR